MKKISKTLMTLAAAILVAPAAFAQTDLPAAKATIDKLK